MDKSAREDRKNGTQYRRGSNRAYSFAYAQKILLFCVPHVNKKSREQFQLCTHKRLLDIYTSSSRTVDALVNWIFLQVWKLDQSLITC